MSPWRAKIENEIREKRILKNIKIYKSEKQLIIEMNFIDNTCEQIGTGRMLAFELGEFVILEMTDKRIEFPVR
jgi:hypothetical protein